MPKPETETPIVQPKPEPKPVTFSKLSIYWYTMNYQKNLQILIQKHDYIGFFTSQILSQNCEQKISNWKGSFIVYWSWFHGLQIFP